MNRQTSRITENRRVAFTLVEVMLAVTISAFLIGMIASAIHLNVRVLQRQQNEIERSQIARNVLMMIKSDIRSAIQYKPADVTGLDALTVSQAAIAGAAAGMEGVDPSMLEGVTGGGGTSSADSGGGGDVEQTEPDESTDNTQNIANGQSEVLRPGLYGNSTEIMIDISRLPRIDQYEPLVVGGDQTTFELPTDVKTIAYFVSDQSEQSLQMSVGKNTAVSGGLYRRQLDRAVAAYSSDLASALAALGNTRLIANEVIGISFRYFDGENWVEQWDSDQEGGFPAAVEVSILVDNERIISEDVSYSMQQDAPTGQAYRTVINLPVAEILSEEELQQIAGGGGAR